MKERAITSPRTALILLIIHNYGALSTPQLAEYLGIPPKHIHGYLKYLRSKGLIRSNSYTYLLTELGEKYVEKYYNHLQYIMRSYYRLNLTKLNQNKLNSTKRIIDYIKDNYDIRDCNGIVRFLVEFRQKTGRKYWWAGEGSHIEELAERLRISSNDVSRCLRLLEAKGVIYLTLDKRRGVVKLRLSRQLDFLFETGNDTFPMIG